MHCARMTLGQTAIARLVPIELRISDLPGKAHRRTLVSEVFPSSPWVTVRPPQYPDEVSEERGLDA